MAAAASVGRACNSNTNKKDSAMNKDRIEGAAKQVKGSIEEGAGSLLGDEKLVVDGKADKLEGKIQNAVGGARDALKK